MKKTAEERLFTGTCWNCNQPISFKGRFHGFIFGNSGINVDCKHCDKENFISVHTETIIKIVKVLIFIILITLLFKTIQAKRLSCDSFTTWNDAQNALQSHPYLDRNHNNIACDNLLK